MFANSRINEPINKKTMTQKQTQTRAMVSLYGRLKYDAELAKNLTKEFTGNPTIKQYFKKVSFMLGSMLTDFTAKMSREQIDAFRKCINEERTAQMENIIYLLQGVPQSNLDEIENVLEDINQKYVK